MKNLWRFIILFLLPGAVFGGGSIIAFFRWGDAPFEPMMAAAAAAVVWTAVFFCSTVVFNHFCNPGSFYYKTILGMTLAFSGAVGLCRFFGGAGWLEGVTGTVISAAAAGGLVHALSSRSFTWKERFCLVLGVAAAVAVVYRLELMIKLVWLETLCFFAEEFLLLSWMLASPLTLRGNFLSRCWRRAAIIAAAAVVFSFSPVFSYQPWSGKPDAMSNGEWQWSYIAAGGSFFGWIDPDDRVGIFSADGQLKTWKVADEEMLIAIPGLLSLTGTGQPVIKLAAFHGSVLPRAVEFLQTDYVRLPESLDRFFLVESTGLWSDKYNAKPVLDEKYDLLLITALNDNPYPGAVRNFWRYLSNGLKKDAVVAVRGGLLQNSELFKILHENFAFNGVLPVPGRLWVFSNRKLDLSREAMAQSLCDLYGDTKDFPLESYIMMLFDSSMWADFSEPPPAEKLFMGKNQWHTSWFWWLQAAIAIAVWRLVRMIGERRNIMYDYWNSLENGFAGMGIFLLVIGLLIMNLGICPLTAALLCMLWVFALPAIYSGGVWLNLIMIVSIPLLGIYAAGNWLWLLLAAAWQQILYTRQRLECVNLSVRDKRRLLTGGAGGMCIAACFMAAVWLGNVPLLPVTAIFFAARVPGIWQYRNRNVHYRK